MIIIKFAIVHDAVNFQTEYCFHSDRLRIVGWVNNCRLPEKRFACSIGNVIFEVAVFCILNASLLTECHDILLINYPYQISCDQFRSLCVIVLAMNIRRKLRQRTKLQSKVVNSSFAIYVVVHA